MGAQVIWAAILQSRPVRWLAGALVALAGLSLWGAAKKREGAVQARNEAELKAANDYRETSERMQDVQTGNDVDAIRSRMRNRPKGKR